VGDKGGEARTLNNLGGVYDDLGEKDKALDYYQQALALSLAVQDPYGEAVTRGNLAVLWWDQGKREEARREMQTARDLMARMGMSTAIQDGWLAKWGNTGAGDKR
jgi:Flp pilus assembly protein TadD